MEAVRLAQSLTLISCSLEAVIVGLHQHPNPVRQTLPVHFGSKVAPTESHSRVDLIRRHLHGLKNVAGFIAVTRAGGAVGDSDEVF